MPVTPRTALALLVVVGLGLALLIGAWPVAAPPPAGDTLQSDAPPKAWTVLAEIRQRHGEPPPGYRGGRTFHNRERRLPPGTYREYDVEPRRPGQPRGPERIVIEQQTGSAYYTGDHYVSFVPMR